MTALPPPRLSVLLPVRDAAPWLGTALASLARQSFSDFEVVAVDDGSGDGSAQILAAWAARDGRFRVLRQGPRGLVAALNAGLARCRAPLVARMDADDVAHPRRFELQLEALETRRLDVVSCQVRHFPRRSVREGTRLYESWLNGLLEHREILRQRFVESPIPHPTALLPRRLLQEAGGYREGPGDGEPWPEDYDLWLRLAATGARFGKVERVLYLWREHPARLTRTDRRYARERFLACKAAHLAAGPLAGAARVVVWGAGPTGRRLTRHLLARGVRPAAFVDIDPKKVSRAPRGVPVHPPEALPGLLAPPGPSVVLAAVAARGARDRVRRRLDSLGLREGRSFWCVA